MVTALVQKDFHYNQEALLVQDKPTLHRGRKGIFNCFSKFSKLTFDLSGLIDLNESENSNFIP